MDAISDGGTWEIWGGPMEMHAPMICSRDEAEYWGARADESKANARLIAAAPEMAEAIAFSKAALAALAGLERDLGEISDDHEIGRIDESRDSPSFRIRVGHIRKMAAAFERATGPEHSVRSDAVTPQF